MVAYAKTAEEIIDVFSSEILRPIIFLLFALALVLFFFGVLEFIANSANEEKRAEGKKHMLWGAIGIAIMTAVNGIIWVLYNFVSQIR